jgi:hypothetical protein
MLKKISENIVNNIYEKFNLKHKDLYVFSTQSDENNDISCKYIISFLYSCNFVTIDIYYDFLDITSENINMEIYIDNLLFHKNIYFTINAKPEFYLSNIENLYDNFL